MLTVYSTKSPYPLKGRTMNLSRSTGYGMVAAAYVAKQGKGAWVVTEEISKKFDIPVEYLLKIMASLVRAGVLQGKRGPKGGFRLAKPAREITLLQIVEAVNGPLKGHLEIAEQAGRQAFGVKMEKAVRKALDQAVGVFEKAKLSDMIE